MKRHVLLIAVIALLTIASVYAGGEDEANLGTAEDPVNLSILMWGGEDRLNWQAELFGELYPELAEGINVSFVSGGKNDGESLQKFRLSLASGVDIPDIVHMNNSSLLEWVQSGIATDLTDRVNDSGYTLIDGARALVEHDDRIWAVPSQVKSKTWFYRPDLFAQAGIDPESIRTFDDFVAAGQQMREALPDTYIINMGSQPAHYWWDGFMLDYEDFTIANEDGTFNVTTDERFAEIFERIKTLSTSGIALPVEDWSSDWQPSIQEGKIASFLIQSWMVEFLRQFAPEQKGLWEIAPWPEFARNGGQGGVRMIPEASESKDAAFAYLQAMQLSPAGKIGLWRQNGIAPVTVEANAELNSMLPTIRESMTDEEWEASFLNFYGMEVMEKILDTTQYIKIFEYDPAYKAEKTILRRHLAEYILDNVTLEEALEMAQQDMEQQIGNPYN